MIRFRAWDARLIPAATDEDIEFIEHFIPTHSSWLNLVERRSGEITNQRIRRGNWPGIDELEKAITGYVKQWNKSGRRFAWTKPADEIKQNTTIAP